MAVSTNLGLYLPTRDDYISVQRDLSSNYEVIDEHAGMLENGLAVVVNGDTAPKAITSGQYLFIKNHSTLATGGYHATANIALGATISNSNVAADADGVINVLNSKFTNNFTLLWTNTNTETDFASQTVAIDLSAYKAVLVYFMEYKTSTRQSKFSAIGTTDGENSYVICHYINNYSVDSPSCRNFSANSTGVSFSVGSTTGGVNNGACIPYKIYGIY